MKRVLIILAIGVVVLAALVGGGGALAIYYYSKDLPDHKQLAAYDPSIVTRLHAGDGRLIAEYAIEKRVFVPLSAIPKLVVQAFLSAEDKNFYEHFGVDPMSLVSALWKNVTNLGGDKKLVGASTITQQVTKNFLLSNEVSFSRKIKEAILAVRIEESYSKERILELYLNQIYLGLGSYGVAAAALDYFNKSLDELTVAEAAFLAALPKAPNNYHPVRFHDAAVARRNWVIDQMAQNGAISAGEAAAQKAEPLAMRARDTTELVQADYFAEEARRWLITKYGEDKLYRGGLSVRTTLDPKLQALAETAFHNGLSAYDRRHGWRGPLASVATEGEWKATLAVQAKPVAAARHWQLALVLSLAPKQAEIGLADGTTGAIALEDLAWARRVQENGRLGPAIKKAADALKQGDVILVESNPKKEGRFFLRQVPLVRGGMVVMDPHTGRVLAMVGGLSYAESEFNRATQAQRQPGSSFKPFIYLAALDHGFTPSTIVNDAPIELPQGPGLPLWRPQNYGGDFAGPATLRYGLEQSRNLMTVRIAKNVGMEVVADYAKRLGVNDDLPRVLSTSLGSAETTLIRMTAAYAMFVNGGKRVEPALIERIQDKTGATLYRRDTRSCTACLADAFGAGAPQPELPDAREAVLDPVSAYQIVSMLEGVVQRGTARIVSSLGVPLAGKTGTSNDFKDAWFIGFSPDLVVGTYVGFDQPENLGKGEAGGRVAAPIFREFMAEAIKGRPVVPFRVPNGVRFARAELRSGQTPAGENAPVVLEAFRKGTENEHLVLSDTGDMLTDASDAAQFGATEGGGEVLEGLY
jgi:penicillin-binding protein 1A